MILLVLDSLEAFSDDHPKSTLFPEIIKTISTFSNNVQVLTLSFPTKDQVKYFKEALPMVTLLYPRLPRILNKYITFIRLLSNTFASNYVFHLLLYLFHFPFFIFYTCKKSFRLSVALHGAVYGGFFCFLLYKTLKLDYYILDHKTSYVRGAYSASQKKILKRTIINSQKTAFVSSSMRTAALNSLFISPNASKYQVIPNPLPDKLLSNNFSSHHQKLPFVYGSWTNWRHIKRLDLLIAAFTEAAIPDSQLYIFGKISSDVWKSLNHPLPSNIIIQGFIPKPKLYAYLSSVNVCIIPSDFETFGLPAIEALALSIPVICTSCGGPEEIISSDSLGIVIEKNNHAQLVDAMRNVHANMENYDLISLRRNAIEHFGREALDLHWKTFLSTDK